MGLEDEIYPLFKEGIISKFKEVDSSSSNFFITPKVEDIFKEYIKEILNYAPKNIISYYAQKGKRGVVYFEKLVLKTSEYVENNYFDEEFRTNFECLFDLFENEREHQRKINLCACLLYIYNCVDLFSQKINNKEREISFAATPKFNVTEDSLIYDNRNKFIY